VDMHNTKNKENQAKECALLAEGSPHSMPHDINYVLGN